MTPFSVPALAAALIALFCPGAADASATAVEAARNYRVANEQEIVASFREFLSLPNVAADLDAMGRNADWLSRALRGRGFDVEIWRAGGAPYVFARRDLAEAQRTVLIYAHFDGQPVQPGNWASPPWQPTLRNGLVENGSQVIPWEESRKGFDPEWRIFARSAGDDKAPVIALLAALAALDDAGIAPTVNIRLILDGEEEAGSPSLPLILAKYGDALRADLMLFCDGPMHQSRRRQLVFGVRGSMTLDITTYGPVRPLHSGHYGNWAPNPAETLVRVLAAMKDADGNILVPGYDDAARPVSEAERAAIAAMPLIDRELAFELGLGRTDGGGARIEEQVMRPGLIIKGLQAGGVGAQSRNIIQPSATASLNLRLVPDQTPQGVQDGFMAFFEKLGFLVVAEDPGPALLRAHPQVLKADWRAGAYPGFRSPLDSPEAARLIRILNTIDDDDVLLTPTMGGSLPLYLFAPVVKAPIIILPVANHDNNQHGRNENLRLQNLWDAIEVYAALLAGFGK